MKFLIIAITIVAALFGLFVHFTMPSVYSVRSTRGVSIHCEVLGEYPSDVEHIEIIEAKSGRIIWRVKAQGEMFQIRSFDLVNGLNTGILQPYWGLYHSEIPQRGRFDLKPGIAYRASVCAPGWLNICRTTDFSF